MHPRTGLLFFFLLALGCGSTAPQEPATTPERAPAEPAAAPDPRSWDVLDPAYAAPLEALAARLEEQRGELHLPGLALSIVKDDRLIFARGFGLADVEHAQPATPRTIFAIGSSTKAFTATLVGMLADEHKLSFDAPVTDALPWFELAVQKTGGTSSVEFRDLLSHRTGFGRMDILWHAGLVGPEEVLRTALRAEPMAPFRQRFLYNNVMYLAAGEACAALTGTSWAELVRARFFAPLGMQDSVTSVAEAQKDEHLALGYRWDDEHQRFEHLPMRALESIAPAGAINSNVLDLAHWVRFQLGRGEFEGRRLISAESFAETWKPHNSVDPQTSYGLGWFLHDWHGQPYVEHGGNIDGFAAEVALLPESGIGVALLTNVSGTPLQGSIGPQVFEALLGAPASETELAAQPGAAEDLSRYTGTYIANYFQFHDAEFEVLVRNDRLAIDVPGQSVFELLPPRTDGKRPFALVPDAIQADFLEEAGRVVALRLYQNGMQFEVPRPDYEPAAEMDAAELEPFLGSYADPVNGKTFAVVVSRHRLAVDYPEQMVYELLPPDDDEQWVFRATPQMAVEFHFDAADAVESLTFQERGSTRECKRVGGAAPATLPSIDELLTLRRATEFEARLSELGVCRLAGKLRLVHCGIEGTTATGFDASGAFRDETDLSPYAVTRSTYDGSKVLFQSSIEPWRELTGPSHDQALVANPAVLFGDWSRRFDEASVERALDLADGQRLVRVKLGLGEAPPILLDVDARTGDVVAAQVSELVDGLGSFPKTLRFEDWREVEGLRLPMRTIAEDDVTGRVLIQYEVLETGLDRSALASGAAGDGR